jgi:hypothetical protein
MGVFKIIEDRLMKEGKQGIIFLREELTAQKHRASDRLYDGFKATVEGRGDKIVMSVRNKVPYMWTVNNGKAGGVNSTYQEIADWASRKERHGELRFTDDHSRNNFINTVKKRLESKYLTAGGEKVAARRYFFINITVAKIRRSGAKSRIEKDLNKQIQKHIGYNKKEKPIKVAVS